MEELCAVSRDLAQVARLALPYFRSEERWVGLGLLAAILAIELAQVGIAVLLNAWNARFYDALQHKNTAVFGSRAVDLFVRWRGPSFARRLPALSQPRSANSLAAMDDE